MPISDQGRENIRRGHEGRDKESYRENAARMDRILALQQSDPQAFEQLLRKIAGKMLIPHSEGQKEVLTAEQRFLVLCAGRRWGKSQVGAARALRECRSERTICWWIAPTYKVVKRGYEAVIKQMPDGLLTKPAPPDSVFDAGRSVRLEFKNGARMEFYSAERPEGMLGGSCDFAILDEAATMPESTWSQIIRPTLADRQGSALFISTPRARNWFYYLWLRGQSEAPQDRDFKSWRFPSRTNPTIPSAEFDAMEHEMPQVEYEQEVLAEFVSEASSVFRFPKAINPETGEEDDALESPAIQPIYPPAGHVVLGIDLAKHSDFTVLCGVRAHDRMPCYHDRFNQVSWPKQRARIHEAVEVILDTAEHITIVMDVGGPGDVIYDDLTEEGLDIIPINFTKYKEQMVKLLTSDLEQGRAFIHHDQLSEFEHYAYTITSSGRWRYEAARGHDDEVSAALLAHWGVAHEGAPNVQTLTVDTNLDAADPYDAYATTSDDFAVDTGLPQERVITYTPPTADELLRNPNVW